MEQTQYYNFPIYQDNDVLSVLTTRNQTVTQIDTAIHDVSEVANKGATDISGLENQTQTIETQVTSLQQTVTEHAAAISGNDSRINGLTQSVSSLENTITIMNEDITDVKGLVGNVYSGTLSAGEETIAVVIGDFTNSSMVDIYTDSYGINPLTVELRPAGSGQPNLCVMTFEQQTTDINIKVVIRG